MTTIQTSCIYCTIDLAYIKACSENFEKRLLCLSCLSVRPRVTTGVPTGRICMKFGIFQKSVEKIQVPLKFDKNKGGGGTLHEHQYTFLIIPDSVLYRIRNVLDKSCRENQNTYFTTSNFFSVAVYEMWKNNV